jgi:hypothetical protein
MQLFNGLHLRVRLLDCFYDKTLTFPRNRIIEASLDTYQQPPLLHQLGKRKVATTSLATRPRTLQNAAMRLIRQRLPSPHYGPFEPHVPIQLVAPTL